MFGFGVGSVPDGTHVCLEGRKRRTATGLEILDESRRAPLGDVEDVIEHENLSVDVRSGADADDGNIERARYRAPDFVRHSFEEHDVGAGILEAPRCVLHFPGLFGLPALHLEAADFVH